MITFETEEEFQDAVVSAIMQKFKIQVDNTTFRDKLVISLRTKDNMNELVSWDYK